MSVWQPIETAPEDTEVIVWDSKDSTFYKAWSFDWDIDKEFGHGHRWHYLDGDGVTECYPTHWMIPEPPE
jgi:hypothetical protein